MEILGLIIEVELKQLTQFAIWNEGNISGHTDYVCVFIAFTIIYVITLKNTWNTYHALYRAYKST